MLNMIESIFKSISLNPITLKCKEKACENEY